MVNWSADESTMPRGFFVVCVYLWHLAGITYCDAIVLRSNVMFMLDRSYSFINIFFQVIYQQILLGRFATNNKGRRSITVDKASVNTHIENLY